MRPDDWPPPRAIATFADGDPDETPWVSGAPSAERIEVAPYRAEWPALFEATKAEIGRALPGVAIAIEHIGSTAVPALAAKPIIDIDLIVEDSSREETYVPRLAVLGFQLIIRERTWYEHRMLRREEPPINLHVFGRGCPEHARHILFRDWLRSHPRDRERYERAKADARIGAANMAAYNAAKQSVIRDIYRSIFTHRGWINI